MPLHVRYRAVLRLFLSLLSASMASLFTAACSRRAFLSVSRPLSLARSIHYAARRYPQFPRPRAYQHLAPQPPPTSALRQTPENAPKVPKKPSQLEDIVSESQNVTAVEQRRSDWTIIKKLLVNVWPKNDWKTRGIVVLGFVLLFAGKVRVPLARFATVS